MHDHRFLACRAWESSSLPLMSAVNVSLVKRLASNWDPMSESETIETNSAALAFVSSEYSNNSMSSV